MTKTQITATLAERTGLTKDDVGKVMDEMVKLAYAEAANGFVIPGLGKLVLQAREARTGRNPATGESIQIPAKTVVKFRLAKECKDSVMGAK
jgi:DNA-binding protein HU-beta